MAAFTDRLQFIKTERNLLQKDLAKAAGISLRTYQRYESGERLPDTEVIVKLADFLNVSTDYLLGRTGNRVYLGKLLYRLKAELKLTRIENGLTHEEMARELGMPEDIYLFFDEYDEDGPKAALL